MVTYLEILMGRDKAHPLSEEQWRNLADLLVRVAFVRFHWGKPLIVSSGYRPAAINKAVGGAKSSNHTKCKAVDFADPTSEFRDWCLANFDIIQKAGLYMEDPRYTKNWIHLQTTPTKNNPFIP